MKNLIYYGDEFKALEYITKEVGSETIDLVYIQASALEELHVNLSRARMKIEKTSERSYSDLFDKEASSLKKLMGKVRDAMSKRGSLYFHGNYEYIHYYKSRLLDDVFTRSNFINEIVLFRETGEKARTKWIISHENILLYVKDAQKYIFNTGDIDRVPYMAPALVGPKKEKRGKLPTDTWLSSAVTSNFKERIIRASSKPKSFVLEVFARDTMFAEVCLKLDRRFILVCNDKKMMSDLVKKFSKRPDVGIVGYPDRNSKSRSDETRTKL